ncbi:hypothetical protein BDY24DRAFT_419418 [Mrakia frigida]|uniref:uncharacterized protein n=1 Tax=Mrakia frigida TaxID=29902 RepID=UPI003FCBFA62
MPPDYRLELEAASVFSAALFNYRDNEGTVFGIPHAFAGPLLPALLGFESATEPLESPLQILLCTLGVKIKHLKKAIQQATDEQPDGIVQLQMQSAVGYHCVWYTTQSNEMIRIDVFAAGEYGPRDLFFSSDPNRPSTLLELRGILFLSVTEYLRATLRREGARAEEVCWLIVNYADYIDPTRTEELENFSIQHPEIAEWWAYIRGRWGLA